MTSADDAENRPLAGTTRRWVLLAVGVMVGVIVALAVVGLRDESGAKWRPQPIAAFEEAPGTNLYSVGFHCHEAGRVTASESSDRISLTLEVLGEPLGTCTSSEPVVLDEPRGDREVIDTTTGRAVPDSVD